VQWRKVPRLGRPGTGTEEKAKGGPQFEKHTQREITYLEEDQDNLEKENQHRLIMKKSYQKESLSLARRQRQLTDVKPEGTLLLQTGGKGGIGEWSGAVTIAT